MNSRVTHAVLTILLVALCTLSTNCDTDNRTSDTLNTTPDAWSTGASELSSAISPDQILVGMQMFYGEGDIKQDAEYAYLCVAFRNNPTDEGLAGLIRSIQAYPEGYLPRNYSKLALDFGNFNQEQGRLLVWSTETER